MKPQPISGWEIFTAISTGFAAIFTAAGVITALIVAFREYRIGKQRQVAATEAAERAQADMIAAWLTAPVPTDPDQDAISGLSNASPVPIYNVAIAVVGIQGATGDGPIRSTVVSVIPPGQWWVKIGGQHMDPSMHRRYGAEIAFTDAAGRSWHRTADGKLKPITVEPPEIFGIHRPYSYDALLATEPPEPPEPFAIR